MLGNIRIHNCGKILELAIYGPKDLQCVMCQEILGLTTVVNIRISNILITYLGQRSRTYNMVPNIMINNCVKKYD